MKTLVKISTLLLLLSACGPSENKEELLGAWQSVDNVQTEMQMSFYKDSLVVTAFFGDYHTNSNWALDGSKIHLTNTKMKNVLLNKKTLVNKEIIYKYLFNATKDTLEIEVITGSPFKPSKFIRIEE